MWGKLLAMLIAGLAIAGVNGGADAARLELLGQPCRAKNVLACLMVKDRATGREMLVLSNMNENSGAELIFVDYQNDTAKVYRAPAGAGAWGLNEIPGDRLVVSTFYDGVFMIFDLKKMEFVKVADFPGETYIWTMAMGSDGRIYGGTYPGGKLGALDLTTYEVEDCGAPAPPNLYLRYVSPTPSGDILCFFNTEKPTTLLYDPATKKFRPAPPAVSGGVRGAVWNGYFIAGRQVFEGKELTEVKPIPWPTPPPDKGAWLFDISLTTPDTVYMRQGETVYSYTKGDKEIKVACDLDLLRGGLRGAASNGDLLGLRGQDYFVIRPGDKEIKLRPIPAESGPRDTHFLRVGPDGTLWGGPTFGQTLWHMDPKTRKAVNTGAVSDSGGEVYDVAFVDGKVYAVAYAGGDIVRYDPAQPWDQVGKRNPVVIKKVGSKYIRPEAGVSVGPDGKLYAGWLAQYGTYGGAVSITDPKTGDTELIENPLGEQAVTGVLRADDAIFVGTSLSGNGLPHKKGEWARFGIVDPKTKDTVFQHEFEGYAGVRVLAYDQQSRRVFLAVGGKPMLFDSKVRGFVKDLDGAAKVGGRSVAVPGDGSVVYGSGKSVVRLDMRTGETSVVVEAPENVHNVAVGPNGELYISCGVDVYAVR